MDYEKYLESLSNTPEPQNPKKLQIDYQGLIAYAKEKNTPLDELSEEEKARFIIR